MRSSWDEFAANDAPLVITVCDSAAKEACPYWPGSPVPADPSSAPGTELDKRNAFEVTRQAIGYPMLQAMLPIDAMNDTELRQALARIGST